MTTDADDELAHATDTLAAITSSRLRARRQCLFGRRRWWFFGRDYECLWPFTTAWSALCSARSLTSLAGQAHARDALERMCRGLTAYSREPDIFSGTSDAGFESVVTPPRGPGGDRYYDDNAWLGLALVRQHELTGEADLLSLAERVFAFVATGWSAEPTWRIPGGIRWKEPASNLSRNACVNGPAAELAARLYEKTGDVRYLDWAVRIYDWTRAALLDHGLYVDQIAPDGRRDQTIWSYNQGAMIGAGVLLARRTGEPSFLDNSVETAGAYVASRDVGDLLTQDPAFNAVFFRNLLLLDEERPDPRHRQLCKAYGSAMWSRGRRRHGLFAGNGSPLNNTAAMVEIYALGAGATPHA